MDTCFYAVFRNVLMYKVGGRKLNSDHEANL